MVLKRSRTGVIAAVAATAVLGTVEVASVAAGAGADVPRYMASDGYVPDTVEVKFAEASQVVIRGDQFVSETEDLSMVNAYLAANGSYDRRSLIADGTDKVRARQNQLRAQGAPAPDLASYYRFKLRGGNDSKEVAQMLKKLPSVVEAYPAPLASPSPTTPSFVSTQTYLGNAPSYMGINAAAGLSGALGNNVRIADLEYSWSTTHEDLPKNRLPGALWAVGTPANPFPDNEHGTAVSGIIGASRNSFGINGIASNGQFHMVNTYSLESGWDVADAVYTAAAHMTPGDVILLEQQTQGPDNGPYVPVEWTPSVYDAIKLATAAKIIVIEAAGNGGVNLSDPLYGTSFPSGKADSGAIIVGAGSACGTSPSHYRTSSSNYGARVNMQGNGECVATTGYANYYGSTATNNSYTNSFNGTSAASALVAAAAAAVSSSYEALYKVAATSATVKNAIKSTGTAQDITVNPGNIGPLPNLVAAIKSLDKIAPTVPQAVSVSLNTYNQPLVKWTASTDNTGVTKYKIYRSGTLIATTGAVIQYLDRTAAAHTSYTYQIRAVDGVGNMSAKSVIVSITTR